MAAYDDLISVVCAAKTSDASQRDLNSRSDPENCLFEADGFVVGEGE